jgi:hypothetical protein
MTNIPKKGAFTFYALCGITRTIFEQAVLNCIRNCIRTVGAVCSLITIHIWKLVVSIRKIYKKYDMATNV